MGVKSLPKTVTGERRNCGLNPGPSVCESSTLTTRLPSHPLMLLVYNAYYHLVTRKDNASIDLFSETPIQAKNTQIDIT